MTGLSIDLSKNIDPFTIICLTDLRNIAKELDIDFFVVGALARILILEQYYQLPANVATRDIDIGITVIDWEHYIKLKNSLISSGSFVPDGKVFHRLQYRNKYPLDIIPFGALESPKGLIRWPPDQAIEMNVTGFREAFDSAIIVHLAKGLDVRFVSLPGMAILKLIAWNGRHHEYPTKDAVDIALLLKYYPDAGNEERIFNEHKDLMEIEDFDFELAGARMLGRDMANIMNRQTKTIILDILTQHADPDSNDDLILSISTALPGKNYNIAMKLLENLKKGILDSDK